MENLVEINYYLTGYLANKRLANRNKDQNEITGRVMYLMGLAADLFYFKVNIENTKNYLLRELECDPHCPRELIEIIKRQ